MTVGVYNVDMTTTTTTETTLKRSIKRWSDWVNFDPESMRYLGGWVVDDGGPFPKVV